MSRIRALAWALALAVVLLLVSCSLSAALVHQGLVAPPDIRLEFGGVRLVNSTSILPECARILSAGCRSLHPEPVVVIYTLWLLQQRNPGSWSNPRIVQLLRMHIMP